MIEVATWLDPKIVNGGVHPKNVWPICGQNSQHRADSGW